MSTGLDELPVFGFHDMRVLTLLVPRNMAGTVLLVPSRVAKTGTEPKIKQLARKI